MGVIQSGRVTLNGTVIKEPSTPVDPRKDKVTVDGRSIEAKNLDYIMLNKPKNVITSMSDPLERPTVADFIGELPARVFPIGRLEPRSRLRYLRNNTA